MRADLENIVRLFCPDGSFALVPASVQLSRPNGSMVVILEERQHAAFDGAGDGAHGASASVSVAYQFLVESMQYCVVRNTLREKFSNLKPEGVAVRHNLNLPESYVPYLTLPVIDASGDPVPQPIGSEIMEPAVDVRLLNAGNGFYGREIKDGERVTGVEYVKTSYTGERGVIKLLVVGIYRNEETIAAPVLK
ncbi:MAG: hypothetical protein Q7R76_03545 [Candidatus Woesearchaeota archaeon]|nr:hypothetical protein [Candidatus Woesearchaeota archaeon]